MNDNDYQGNLDFSVTLTPIDPEIVTISTNSSLITIMENDGKCWGWYGVVMLWVWSWRDVGVVMEGCGCGHGGMWVWAWRDVGVGMEGCGCGHGGMWVWRGHEVVVGVIWHGHGHVGVVMWVWAAWGVWGSVHEVSACYYV